jgi:O-succinylbenzoic acid--CoA ligase
MTETCGGCVYDGVALDGVEVRIGADEQVLLAGPVLFDGYAGDPAATAAVLDDGWLRTGDLGRLDRDGRLEVTGRLDDAVLSGGVRVHLTAVEQALRSHPGIADAAVTAVTDDEWGSRVVAVVVVAAETPSLASVRTHVGATLPRSWAPRELRVVGALPRLAGGQVDRLALPAVAAAGQESEEGPGPG